MGKFVIRRANRFYGMWGWMRTAHADGVMVFSNKADAEAHMKQHAHLHGGEVVPQPPKIEPGRTAAPKLFSHG